jgi:hypothetical protein
MNQMTNTLWFYLKNIFINPVAAATGIKNEKKLWPLILVSSLLGFIPYWLIVLLGYSALGWESFPYKQYYPCYFFGRWFRGKATFWQVVAIVMLASVVSLPIFVLVDLTMYNPNQVIEFAKTGIAIQPFEQGDSRLVWFIQQSYAYIAMGWQGIVTVVGLSVLHQIRWAANIPGIVTGNILFIVFLVLIRDYVALII